MTCGAAIAAVTAGEATHLVMPVAFLLRRLLDRRITTGAASGRLCRPCFVRRVISLSPFAARHADGGVQAEGDAAMRAPSQALICRYG
jgi:hypothetical protein